MVIVYLWCRLQQGIEFAQSVFPELASIEPEHISICVNGCVQRQRTLIRIGPMAWASVVPTLARYEVLEILVKNPEIVIDSADPVDALPNYEDVKEKSGSSDFLAPSRGPSPAKKIIPLPELQRIVEKNSGRSSRSPSPSSSRPSSMSSSSISDWAKGLFGKKAE